MKCLWQGLVLLLLLFYISLGILPEPTGLASHPFLARSDLHFHSCKGLGVGKPNTGKLYRLAEPVSPHPIEKSPPGMILKGRRVEGYCQPEFQLTWILPWQHQHPISISNWNLAPKKNKDLSCSIHTDLYVHAWGRTSAGEGAKHTPTRAVPALPSGFPKCNSNLWHVLNTICKTGGAEGSVRNKAVSRAGLLK